MSLKSSKIFVGVAQKFSLAIKHRLFMVQM
jgi:hypothetical protein